MKGDGRPLTPASVLFYRGKTYLPELGAPACEHAHRETHHARNADHLPGIVAHETVGALADLPGAGADLSRRVGSRAFCGGQPGPHFGADPGNVGRRDVL